MLISEKMNAALNEQIGHEFGASLQYVAIAAYFDCDNLPELSAHFYRQADEEREHAMRIVNYLVDARGNVVIPAVPAPKSEFASAEEALQLSLDWELTVTKQIDDLVNLALQENDNMTHMFLQWFVGEQLEEVSSMETLLGMIQRAGNQHLLLVEAYLARHSGGRPSGARATSTAT
jgi:ferritin